MRNWHPEADVPDLREARAVLERLAAVALPAQAPQQACRVATAPLPPRPDVLPVWTAQSFGDLVEALPDAVVVIDQAGTIVFLNHQTEALFGYSRGELLGQAIEVLVPEHQRDDHVEQRSSYFAAPRARPMGSGAGHLVGRRKDGSDVPVEISLSPLSTPGRLLVTAVVRDITARRREEIKFRTLVEHIPAVTFIAPLDESVAESYVSPQIEQLLGFSQTEWLEDPVLWYRQLHPDDRDRWSKHFAPTCAAGTPFKAVYRFLAKDGRVVWVHGSANVVRDPEGKLLFLQGVAFDISSIKEAELERERVSARLQNSLEEKEVLLKEIHHRVKNNLQVISSLLDLQSQYAPDAPSVEMFRESQNRVRSMALIHERLYRAQDLSRVDFAEYIEGLVDYLLQSYRVDTNAIRLDFFVAQDVQLAIDTAVPCGLVVNELVSNCFKHAFQGRDSGVIRIELRSLDGARVQVAVADNGRGLPEDVNPYSASTFGLQLVALLAGQLKGSLTTERTFGPPAYLGADTREAKSQDQTGTTFTLTFPLPKPVGTWREIS